MSTFHLTATALLAAAMVVLWRGRPGSWARVLAGFGVLGGGLAVASWLCADGIFGLVGCAFAAVAFYVPVYVGMAGIVKVRRSPLAGGILLALAATIMLTAAYARFVEPNRLQVRHVTISDARVHTRLRIAFITDIQTDAPGRHEEKALHRLMAARPDLVLFGGDYVQDRDERKADACRRVLNRMLRDAGIEAPLGAFAVRGNIGAHEPWQVIFDGTGVHPVESTQSREPRDDVRLVLLSYPDSLRLRAPLPPSPRFTVIVGHCPDYAIGGTGADLLLAGHTHGGQVHLPFIGPVLTLSNVRRSWASGVTRLEGGRTLIVSNGVGVERKGAPRIRFLCPPGIYVIDLQPGTE